MTTMGVGVGEAVGERVVVGLVLDDGVAVGVELDSTACL